MDETILIRGVPSHIPVHSGVVTVTLIDPERVSSELARACLTMEERLRADRFRFQKDALHWTACRASLRVILGSVIHLPPQEVPLIYLEFGKPALSRPYEFLHFNLSHCANLAAIALSIDGPVGIDLEAKERASDLLGCESTFCHPAEIGRLSSESEKRSFQLLRIWTAKEAILKAFGTGLSSSPAEIQTIFEKDKVIIISEKSTLNTKNINVIKIKDSRLVNYQAFVSSFSSSIEIETIPW